MIHGRNLIILADGVAIAAAKSCEISVNTEAYEVSSPATAGWRYRKVGRSEWSVSVSTLVTTVRDRKKWRDGEWELGLYKVNLS